MSAIPEGYGVIAGRSSKNARAALDAAAKAGVDVAEVKAVPSGYLVPDAVLDAFHEAVDGTADDAEAHALISAFFQSEVGVASAHDVDLGDATTKADMLEAIASATGKE